MKQFLEKYKLPKLTKKETDKLNSPMATNDIKLQLKSIK